MAREPQAPIKPSAARTPSVARERRPSKLDLIEVMLRREGGASIAEIMLATDWQQHSVRGAMAGALKKRGLVITSDKTDGARCYRAGEPS